MRFFRRCAPHTGGVVVGASGVACALGLSLFALGCDAGEAHPARESSQALRDGELTSDPRWEAVVHVEALLPRLDGGKDLSFCAGAMVAPNLVVTAAHCVASRTAQPPACESPGDADRGRGLVALAVPEDVAIYASPNAAQPLSLGQDILTPKLTTIACGSDLSFIVLHDAVEQLPTLPLELDAPPQRGRSVDVFGFGKREARSSAPRLNQVRATVERTAGASGELATGAMRLDAGLCPRDSGGPVIDPETGRVVAVTSIGGSLVPPGQAIADACLLPSSVGYATVIAAHRELAISALRRSGARPAPRSNAGCSAAQLEQSSGASLTAGLFLVLAAVWLVTRRALR